jgi:hypothetical protein
MLEFNLKALIAKATEEYTNIATKDPVIASEDDDTARGDELDQILAQQENERKELWDQLYAVSFCFKIIEPLAYLSIIFL